MFYLAAISLYNSLQFLSFFSISLYNPLLVLCSPSMNFFLLCSPSLNSFIQKQTGHKAQAKHKSQNKKTSTQETGSKKAIERSTGENKLLTDFSRRFDHQNLLRLHVRQTLWSASTVKSFFCSQLAPCHWQHGGSSLGENAQLYRLIFLSKTNYPSCTARLSESTSAPEHSSYWCDLLLALVPHTSTKVPFFINLTAYNYHKQKNPQTN